MLRLSRHRFHTLVRAQGIRDLLNFGPLAPETLPDAKETVARVEAESGPLVFLGSRTPVRTAAEIEAAMNGFTVTPWIRPLKTRQPKLSLDEVTARLAELHPDGDLREISTRFRVAKQFQELVGWVLPDRVLTTVTSTAALAQAYVAEVRVRNEKLPDAIYLDPKEFEGTNVRIAGVVRKGAAKWRLQQEAAKLDK